MVDARAFLRDGKTALVLIDLQRGIVARDLAPRSGAQVVGHAATLVTAFRAANVPVVFVRVIFGTGGQDMLRPIVDAPVPMPAFTPDLAEFAADLQVNASDVIVTKRNWGAFHGTDLDLQLRRRDVTRIALCGISTNIGVESTARDAFERNYKLLFVEDAMTAMSAQEHDHSCRLIFPRMGIVRSTADVLAALD
jgi:nicotinamidase-related amidase